MNVVYLVHKMRRGKPIEVKAANYNKNPMAFGKDGWRQATIEEIKDAGYEVEEIKPKKKTTKKEVKED